MPVSWTCKATYVDSSPETALLWLSLVESLTDTTPLDVYLSALPVRLEISEGQQSEACLQWALPRILFRMRTQVPGVIAVIQFSRFSMSNVTDTAWRVVGPMS
jgi:hypothetical protein